MQHNLREQTYGQTLTGITGNERADELAKLAATQDGTARIYVALHYIT